VNALSASLWPNLVDIMYNKYTHPRGVLLCIAVLLRDQDLCFFLVSVVTLVWLPLLLLHSLTLVLVLLVGLFQNRPNIVLCLGFVFR
jgi:hypothetical protein